MQQHFSEEDIRLVDVLESLKGYLGYLLKKWYLSIVGVIGLTFGGYYFAKVSPPKYIANISFNAVDSRASSMGGIMSMMGISFAGGSSNDVLTGIFTSRNIFLNSMLEDVVVDGKKEKLGNLYIHAHKYDEGFDKDPEWKGFKFKANSIKEISKKEMDLLSVMYDDFSDGLMTAEYDIATGLIKAEIESPDYEVSRQTGAALLRNTLEFYQNKQVENATVSLKNTTQRMDSISREIKLRQRMIAESQDQNIFNLKKITIVEQQKLMQEIGMLNVMYNDAATSKENAKAGVNPSTNIVRVIDDPMFSTAPKHPSKLLYGAIGFVLSLVLIIIPLLIKKALIDGREEDRLRALKEAESTTVTNPA